MHWILTMLHRLIAFFVMGEMHWEPGLPEVFEHEISLKLSFCNLLRHDHRPVPHTFSRAHGHSDVSLYNSMPRAVTSADSTPPVYGVI